MCEISRKFVFYSLRHDGDRRDSEIDIEDLANLFRKVASASDLVSG